MVKWLVYAALASLSAASWAQSTPSAQNLPAAQRPTGATTVHDLPNAPEEKQCDLNAVLVCVKHVAEDEKGILLSPLHAPAENLLWIVPFGVATGVSVHYDTDAIRDLGVHPSREDKFNKLSDYAGLYGPIAAVGAGYFVGRAKQDNYLKETAVLTEEAMVDAAILDQAMKYALDREYPMAHNARGGLWPGGPKSWPNNPSMPSEHAMNIWAFAHVVAGQYNGIATKSLVYGVATTVSVSRVLARQHFPSDVLVGSTFGWLIGGYVLHHRSLEHGTLLDLSTVETPLGSGVQVRVRLGRGQ